MAEPADAVRIVIDGVTDGRGTCLSLSTALSHFSSLLQDLPELFPGFCVRPLPENAVTRLRI